MKEQEAIISRLKWLIEQHEKGKLEILYFDYKVETHPTTFNGINVVYIDTGIRKETITWKEK